MDAVSTFYLTQGVLGATVVVLLIVAGVLYRDNKRLEREKIEILNAHNTLMLSLMREVMELMSETSQNVRVLGEKIEVGKRR